MFLKDNLGISESSMGNVRAGRKADVSKGGGERKCRLFPDSAQLAKELSSWGWSDSSLPIWKKWVQSILQKFLT